MSNKDKAEKQNYSKYWGYAVFTFMGLVLLFMLLINAGTILGNTVIIVQSGSMQPEIAVGSIIVSTESDSYQVGDVISFSGRSLTNDFVTHRVTEVLKDENGETLFRTKGDANQIEDAEPISIDNVIGKMTLNIPYAGTIYDFIKSPIGLLIVLLIPGIYVFREELVKLIRFLKISNLRKLSIKVEYNDENK